MASGRRTSHREGLFVLQVLLLGQRLMVQMLLEAVVLNLGGAHGGIHRLESLGHERALLRNRVQLAVEDAPFGRAANQVQVCRLD